LVEPTPTGREVAAAPDDHPDPRPVAEVAAGVVDRGGRHGEHGELVRLHLVDRRGRDAVRERVEVQLGGDEPAAPAVGPVRGSPDAPTSPKNSGSRLASGMSVIASTPVTRLCQY